MRQMSTVIVAFALVLACGDRDVPSTHVGFGSGEPPRDAGPDHDYHVEIESALRAGSLAAKRQHPFDPRLDPELQEVLNSQCDARALARVTVDTLNDPRFTRTESLFCDEIQLVDGSFFHFRGGAWRAGRPPR